MLRWKGKRFAEWPTHLHLNTFAFDSDDLQHNRRTVSPYADTMFLSSNDDIVTLSSNDYKAVLSSFEDKRLWRAR